MPFTGLIENLFARPKGIRAIYDTLNGRLSEPRAVGLDRLPYLTGPASLAAIQGSLADLYPTNTTEMGYLAAIWRLLSKLDTGGNSGLRVPRRAEFIPGDHSLWCSYAAPDVSFYSQAGLSYNAGGYPYTRDYFFFPNFLTNTVRTNRGFQVGPAPDTAGPIIEVNASFEWPWLYRSGGVGFANKPLENMADAGAVGVWMSQTANLWGPNGSGAYPTTLTISGGSGGVGYGHQVVNIDVPFGLYPYPAGFTVSVNKSRIAVFSYGPAYVTPGALAAQYPPFWPWPYPWPWPYSWPWPYGNLIWSSTSLAGYVPAPPQPLYPMLSQGSSAAYVVVDEVQTPNPKPVGPGGLAYDPTYYGITP